MNNTVNTTEPRYNYYFADNYTYTGTYNVPTSIRLLQYNKQHWSKTDVNVNTHSFKDLVKPDCINWFKVKGLTDAVNISRLMVEFGLSNLDIRDVLMPHHIVKIDNTPHHILIIVNNCTFNAKNHIASEHVGIIVVGNVVITLTETDKPYFSNAEMALKNNVMHLCTRPSGLLLGFILNTLFVDLIHVAGKIEKQLEEMEDGLLGQIDSQKNIGANIQRCRHAYLIIRKNTRPLYNEFSKLLKTKEGVIDEAMLPLFEELSDQLEYIIQTIENSREVLTSLVDIYVSNNDLKMNAIMKRLTAVSTLFIPITFLVGLWGMNFASMPELNWKYGYVFAWAVIICTITGTWVYMKKKKWF